MSFSKRPRRNTPQCYTKPLNSLKNWNNHFFWVDERVFLTVVDWRMNAPKDGMPAAGRYSLEAVWVLDTHRTPIKKQPEMLLCLVGISHRYYLGDEVTNFRSLTADMDLFNLIRAPNPTKMDKPAATDSSGVPSTIERSPLDFAHEAGALDQGVAAPEIPSSEDAPATVASGVGQAEETATMDPPTAPESHKRGHDGTDVNALPKSLRRDYADPQPSGSSRGGKSLASIQLGLASIVVPEDAHVGVSDPDLLSFADAPSRHPADIAQSSQGIAAAGDPGSENASSPAEVGSPGSVYRPKWGITNGSLLDTLEACQDLYNINLARQVAMGSQLRLRFEQEAKLLRKSVAQVACRDQRIQARELEIKNLEARLETKAEMKKAAKDKSTGLIKELEDLRARFSDLQVGNEHLSQRVATLQEQVSGEEKLKAAFKEFKRYEDERVEQRGAKLDARLDALSIDFDEELYPHMLTVIAGRRWVIGYGLHLAMMKCAESLEMRQEFVDVVSAGVAKDQLEGLKDAPMDVIMAALYLESDTEGDAPQYICDLRPSSSQLTISVYLEKKKCRIVCRTHGVGSAHHARLDGVPVSVPTVVPQGLALLLVDAATQTGLEDT
nr:transposase (putative), gypsy type [Tanacetum cinerariifolium]